MFSAQLCKTDFYKVKKEYKGRNKQLDKILNNINKLMVEMRKQCGEQGYFIALEKHEDFIKAINKYTATCELMLKENRSLSEDLNFLQLYFDVLGFQTIVDFYDERYVTLVEAQRNEVTFKLFCLDPSFLLAQALQRGSSAIMFSATLSPLAYFREVLGGGEGDKMLSLDSPFDSRSLCVMTASNVSTKYKDREQSRHEIARLIGSFVSLKTGNYIIYFPSYKYMDDVFEEFTLAFPHITAVKQGTAMSEEQREDFLSSFNENPEETYAAFCVLGGIFSEGIDLKGSRLIGTVIVSVGLPQLSIQRNIIRDYFDNKNGMGYEYAYMYPGMNKVLQAAGRVIRCESDTGAVLLIDERYSHKNYLKLFPKHWHSYRNVKNSESLEKTLASFWLTDKTSTESTRSNQSN
jgi:Rad3-related DNA helicase